MCVNGLSLVHVVCNAGVGLMGPLEIQSLDSMRCILEVNLLGTIQTIQAFLPEMKVQGQGRILVTGSTGGLHGETNKWLSSDQMSTMFHMQLCIGLLEPCKKMMMLTAMHEISKITHLGNWCSVTGLPFNEVYCASKFAIEGACESLAVLLQHFNIQ